MIKNLIFKEWFMKKNLLAFSITALMMISGCGGGGDDDSISLDAAEVLYKSAGMYDLSDYIVPKEKSINIYEEATYVNNDGKKRFSDQPDERRTYTEKYDINDTKIIVRNSQDLIEEVYQIESDRIEIFNDTNKLEEKFARYADDGDYVLAKSENVEISNIPTVIKTACKVISHYQTKKFDDIEYSNVVKAECKAEQRGETQSDTFSVSYFGEVSDLIYFAKGIGLVYDETISCSELKTTLNGQSNIQSTCEKTVTNLISHNKF
jgi:hypothetical protein